MTQYARPSSDTAVGTWTTTPLWSKVDDDLVASPTGDGVTILSADNSASDTCTLALSSVTDPGVTTGHVMRVRWHKSGTLGQVVDATCHLVDATNGNIATITVPNIGNTEQEDTLTLDATQVGNITNYGTLSVSLVRSGEVGGPPGDRRSIEVEAFQFEIPDAAAPPVTFTASATGASSTSDTVDVTATRLFAASSVGATNTADTAQVTAVRSFSAYMPRPDEPESGDWSSFITALEPGATEFVDWDFLLWAASGGQPIKVGSTYYFYYVGSPYYDIPLDSPADRAIGLATSVDGVTWVKHGSNPLVTYTTGGSVEEGASNPVVIYDGSTWHMWYGASRDTGGGNVDVDIRYRTSTDGVTWTGDALVYSNAGDEHIPVAAFKEGTTYNLYILGPLSAGTGSLRRMSGTSPTSMGSPTLVLTGSFRSAHALNTLFNETMSLALAQGSWDAVFYRINRSTPGSISSLITSYTRTGYAFFVIMRDDDANLWRQITLDNTGGAGDGNLVQATAPIDGGSVTSSPALITTIAFTASVVAATSTSDTAEATATRSFAASITGASSTSDTVILSTSATTTIDDIVFSWSLVESFAASITGSSSTNDAVEVIASRSFSASITGASSTPDTVDLIATRSFTASMVGATQTGDTVEVTAVRSFAASIIGATNTSDTVVLSTAGLVTFVASATGTSTTSDTVNLTATRSFVASATGASSTSDVVDLDANRLFAASITGASATSDTVVLSTAGVVSFTASIVGTSVTNDTVSPTAIRLFSVSVTATSVTSDTVEPVSQRSFVASAVGVTSTSDTVALDASVGFAASITGVSATADVVEVTAARSFSASVTATSVSNDAVILDTSGFVGFAASPTGVSVTNDTVEVAVARSFTVSITGVSTTSDTVDITSPRPFVASATGASVTSNIAEIVAVRDFAASSTGVSTTSDTVSIIYTRLFLASISANTVTPDDVAITASKLFSLSAVGASQTSDTVDIVAQRLFSASMVGATITSDTVTFVGNDIMEDLFKGMFIAHFKGMR